MLDQGSIIKIKLDPTVGHEQAGYRPALVVSNNEYNRRTGMAIVCPITNTNNHFPLHVALDDRTKTTGCVLCEHVRTLDIESRGYRFVENLPHDLLDRITQIVTAEISR